jgi:hypothetical protein
MKKRAAKGPPKLNIVRMPMPKTLFTLVVAEGADGSLIVNTTSSPGLLESLDLGPLITDWLKKTKVSVK